MKRVAVNNNRRYYTVVGLVYTTSEDTMAGELMRQGDPPPLLPQIKPVMTRQDDTSCRK